MTHATWPEPVRRSGPALPARGRRRSVRAVDLATGEPVPGMACDHHRYREISERLTLRHDYLAWPTTEEVVIPWSVPPQVHDLLATPDGTIVVSSAEGVHILDVDPEEAVRAGRPV